MDKVQNFRTITVFIFTCRKVIGFTVCHIIMCTCVNRYATVYVFVCLFCIMCLQVAVFKLRFCNHYKQHEY